MGFKNIDFSNEQILSALLMCVKIKCWSVFFRRLLPLVDQSCRTSPLRTKASNHSDTLESLLGFQYLYRSSLNFPGFILFSTFLSVKVRLDDPAEQRKPSQFVYL